MTHLNKVLDYEQAKLIELEDEFTQLMIDCWGKPSAKTKRAHKRCRELLKAVPNQRLTVELLEKRMSEE